MNNLRWGTLLLLILSAFLIEPLFGSSTLAELASLVIFELAIVGAVLFNAHNRFVRLFGGIAAVTWFLASLAALSGAQLHGSVAGLSTVLVFGALAVTFSYLMQSGESNLDTLLGAIFGYLLMAMAFAVLFVQIERWQPGSFSYGEGADLWTAMLYYSLVTVSTLGYGDILPLSAPARMAAGFEAVIGTLYLAVMIGSIVGSYRKKS